VSLPAFHKCWSVRYLTSDIGAPTRRRRLRIPSAALLMASGLPGRRGGPAAFGETLGFACRGGVAAQRQG